MHALLESVEGKMRPGTHMVLPANEQRKEVAYVTYERNIDHL